ncbi:MAG: DNA sulfur modification protein DndB [Cycloclasticus sp.]|nr:MAG: DNA sulfur modification protein DndB [Cycloclasticus sp.]
MDTSFEYLFPAIRGIQAGREYYTSMCPLKLIPKIFIFDDEELKPELRAQRILNRSRIPDISSYLIENRKNYVFSAITASIDGKVKFEPFGGGEISRIGTLKVDMNSQFIINDGQHRRAAIAEALKKDPRLGDESIAVVFFIDKGLNRCQQMFADLNRHAVRPSKSLGILYDYRDDKAQITKMVALKSRTFGDLVEMEKSALSSRSRKLFTLSAIHYANNALLNGKEIKNDHEAIEVSIRFWNDVGNQIKEWLLARESKITSGDIRQDFVHCHANILQAMGVMGNALLDLSTNEQKTRLKLLKKIDWKRSNSGVWEGRAMIGGRMQKSSNNVVLSANYIKQQLHLELTPEEQRTEDAFKKD